MMYKGLFYTDWHLKCKDIKSLGGSVQNDMRMVRSVTDHLRDEGYTHAFGAGDLFDRGFSDIALFYHYENALEEMTAAVNGEHYINIGNHFYLQRHMNPELYLIQPCDFKFAGCDLPSGIQPRTKPVLRVTDTILVGCVQISFHHYNPGHVYRPIPRNPEALLHVAIFHDDSCVPRSILEKMNMEVSASSGQLATLYTGVDIAVIGHIHLDFESFRHGSTTIIIPGSMSPTSVKRGSLFPKIELPVLEWDNTSYKLSMVSFDRGISTLRTKAEKTPVVADAKKAVKASAGVMPHGRFFSLSDYAERTKVDPFYVQVITEAGNGRLSQEHIAEYLEKAGNT